MWFYFLLYMWSWRLNIAIYLPTAIHSFLFIYLVLMFIQRLTLYWIVRSNFWGKYSYKILNFLSHDKWQWGSKSSYLLLTHYQIIIWDFFWLHLVYFYIYLQVISFFLLGLEGSKQKKRKSKPNLSAKIDTTYIKIMQGY